MRSRRQFVQELTIGVAAMATGTSNPAVAADPILEPENGEDLLSYIRRNKGTFDNALYCQLLGAANEYKEGDEIIGVAAADVSSRTHARRLLSRTRLADIDTHPPFQDDLSKFIKVNGEAIAVANEWTLSDLKKRLLDASEDEIQRFMPSLSSDVIGCVVKLMSNEELTVVGAKVFNPLPGSKIGAKGYLGARVQPNSPTDHPDDIRWQVFDAFSYAVGDVLLGTNPVSSDPQSVAQVERTLQEILQVFELEDRMPHCVLSHIDVQAQVEREAPNSTELWFQSIAGTDTANATFDLTIEKMREYADGRDGRYGLYFETGQGADFTNGHGHGFDMVLHESRKYGFARTLKNRMVRDGRQPWVHLNDVAGFIGPEVFRTREQLVRCCLEDIVMGKLHGLCIGLDVCSTLHMDVSLDDLDWCLEQVAPASPAYLMALPTKIDPMLGYLTTGFQDHVRLREKFGLKVNDAMWQFFQELGVIGDRGEPTERFGDPTWVYLQYCRRQGDDRSDQEIMAFGRKKIEEVRARGLFIAVGHGASASDLDGELAKQVSRVYEDGKASIWAELQPEFVESLPNSLAVATQSNDRVDYILHPESGEIISAESRRRLLELGAERGEESDLQIVISDGLNALSIMEEGHLVPFLKRLRKGLAAEKFHPAAENLVVTSGRVRTGYQIGETLFANSKKRRSLVHIIGERPGTGHRTFSVYITSALGDVWSQSGKVDHNITRVVSGIATTALSPFEGADAVVHILKS